GSARSQHAQHPPLRGVDPDRAQAPEQPRIESIRHAIELIGDETIQPVVADLKSLAFPLRHRRHAPLRFPTRLLSLPPSIGLDERLIPIFIQSNIYLNVFRGCRTVTTEAQVSEAHKGDVWTSNTAFLFATGAAAIGLGRLWRFPHVAGANGGGAFVIVYILFVIAICVPLMIGEMAIGRSGGGSALASVRNPAQEAGASKFWRTIGWFSILIPFFGLSYYSVVA